MSHSTSASETDNPPLSAGQIVSGALALFNEPMRVETIRNNGTGLWEVGLSGVQTEKFRRVNMTLEQIEALHVLRAGFRYDGDGQLLRVGIQAYALGIAYEFGPYFGLSVSRVDPLPHQLEAVYDYLLKLARVRFLLADDAGRARRSWRVRAASAAQQLFPFLIRRTRSVSYTPLWLRGGS